MKITGLLYVAALYGLMACRKEATPDLITDLAIQQILVIYDSSETHNEAPYAVEFSGPGYTFLTHDDARGRSFPSLKRLGYPGNKAPQYKLTSLATRDFISDSYAFNYDDTSYRYYYSHVLSSFDNTTLFRIDSLHSTRYYTLSTGKEMTRVIASSKNKDGQKVMSDLRQFFADLATNGREFILLQN